MKSKWTKKKISVGCKGTRDTSWKHETHRDRQKGNSNCQYRRKILCFWWQMRPYWCSALHGSNKWEYCDMSPSRSIVWLHHREKGKRSKFNGTTNRWPSRCLEEKLRISLQHSVIYRDVWLKKIWCYDWWRPDKKIYPRLGFRLMDRLQERFL